MSILTGAWNLLNGVLHTIFVLRQGRKYDRELLRLMMDGLLLTGCGATILETASNQEESIALWAGLTAGIMILVYVALIFPFLKSFGTLIINLVFVCWLLIRLIF
jgi:hypothetical protein